jgi:ribosome-binding ATPase YchF (GTP1/OBG family)
VDRYQSSSRINAAGAIYSDFEKGFIRAETMAYDDYVGTTVKLAQRKAGRIGVRKAISRQDGDIMMFGLTFETHN